MSAQATFLASVPMAPRDPILGVTEAFNADANPNKTNLGVGIYYDDAGKVPLLECVRRAEAILADKKAPRSYLPIDGIVAYNQDVQQIVFGHDSKALQDKREITAKAIGGKGALKIGADFLKRFTPEETAVWISDPSWENHRALFESAGFKVNAYPYYKAETRGVDFEGMRTALAALPAGAVVVLHACCHNPTGADLNDAQWNEVIEIVQARKLIPFLDMAYQGFAESLEQDGQTVRRFAEACPLLFVSNSFSKSFSLYGERIGALSILAASAEEASRAMSQLKRVIRTNYFNPATHGGQLVATVLASPELSQQWENELAAMRTRIREMRELLASKLSAKMPGVDFSYIMKQRGMFSYSGLTQPQVAAMRENYSVYAVDTGRICVAALNTRNIDHVVDAIAAALK